MLWAWLLNKQLLKVEKMLPSFFEIEVLNLLENYFTPRLMYVSRYKLKLTRHSKLFFHLHVHWQDVQWSTYCEAGVTISSTWKLQSQINNLNTWGANKFHVRIFGYIQKNNAMQSNLQDIVAQLSV